VPYNEVVFSQGIRIFILKNHSRIKKNTLWFHCVIHNLTKKSMEIDSYLRNGMEKVVSNLYVMLVGETILQWHILY